MKALLIYLVDISKVENKGVLEKMQGQLFGFLENGVQAECIYLNEKGLFLDHQIIKHVKNGSVARKLFRAKKVYKTIQEQINPLNYDVVLFRYHLLFPGSIRLLRYFKERNRRLKVVMDLPTYPYEKERNGFFGNILLRIDRENRSELRYYVDLILHYGAEKQLFGIDCLNISNGILPGKATSVKRVHGERIKLFAVGKWAYWHGLDRLIKGLSGLENISLDVVGEGPAVADLKRDARGSTNVIFHGNLSGKALEDLYEKASIGIGTLGIHRKGVKIDSSLKHRAYCAKGLPFILSSPDIDFPRSLEFVKYFPINDSPIDIDQLKNFYEDSKKMKDIELVMVRFARENLGWGKKVKRILTRLSLLP